ncbi:hypothetical protein SEVIR_7G339100v4 [Setaria viridis]|uniref:Uncharacterized protein n=1 Tax=Setaria viridis TaxID=4556 RepID=A0A4U6U3K3_SETVI|nr:hypothetical protein SEVIR_7G339100v2 [Setaria viridis]
MHLEFSEIGGVWALVQVLIVEGGGLLCGAGATSGDGGEDRGGAEVNDEVHVVCVEEVRSGWVTDEDSGGVVRTRGRRRRRLFLSKPNQLFFPLVGFSPSSPHWRGGSSYMPLLLPFFERGLL